MGEKTSWTYIDIPNEIAEKLNPGIKKSYRVKVVLDNIKINAMALIPIGDGNFILTLNAEIRKNLHKKQGDLLLVKIELDKVGYIQNELFLICLNDEPDALKYFNTLPRGHQNYFSKWIDSAKTEATQSKRITQVLNALTKKWDYGMMIRAGKL